jgi:hypothetical protein
MKISTVIKLRQRIEKILIERQEGILDKIMNAIAAAEEDAL